MMKLALALALLLAIQAGDDRVCAPKATPQTQACTCRLRCDLGGNPYEDDGYDNEKPTGTRCKRYCEKDRCWCHIEEDCPQGEKK